VRPAVRCRRRARGGGGDNRLAAAHVALNQTHHGLVGGEIAIDIGEHP
jgi:hypothetical protein